MRQLHREFLRAGSDVMQALTFYASDDKLENRGNVAQDKYTVWLFAYLSIWLPDYLSVCLSVCLHVLIGMSVYLRGVNSVLKLGVLRS